MAKTQVGNQCWRECGSSSHILSLECKLVEPLRKTGATKGSAFPLDKCETGFFSLNLFCEALMLFTLLLQLSLFTESFSSGLPTTMQALEQGPRLICSSVTLEQSVKEVLNS